MELKTMMKVEVVIHPHKLDDVKAVLAPLGVVKITISQVLHYDAFVVKKTYYRGGECRVDTLKLKLEMLVSAEQLDEVIENLSRTLRTTGYEDDGEILVYEVADAVRIRTGQRLQYEIA
jgi:nitrogen regulatory protein P-II 1